MRNRISIAIFAATWVLAAQGEEKPSPILTSLTSTTISGYVSTSANWTPGDVDSPVHRPVRSSPARFGSSPVRFEELCRALQAGGLQVKGFGNHYLFFRSGKAVLHLCKRGPFASHADVLQVRRFLDG